LPPEQAQRKEWPWQNDTPFSQGKKLRRVPPENSEWNGMELTGPFESQLRA
jgi:hypothetical protein